MLYFALAVFAAVGAVFAAKMLPVDRRGLVEEKYAGWSGVLRVHAAGGWAWEKGSPAAWLSRCASEFEKEHNGVYVQVTEADSVSPSGQDGLRAPDAILFPPGMLTSADGLAPLTQPLPVRDALRTSYYAVPVAAGAYGWAVRAGEGTAESAFPDSLSEENEITIEEDSLHSQPAGGEAASLHSQSTTTIPEDATPHSHFASAIPDPASLRSQPAKTFPELASPCIPSSALIPANASNRLCSAAVPEDDSFHSWSAAALALCTGEPAKLPERFEPPGVDLGLPAFAPCSPEEICRGGFQDFTEGRVRALAVSQSEIGRLGRMGEAGRAPEWTLDAMSEFTFTDQLLLFAVPEADEDPERQQLILAFLEHLLSDGCQSGLTRYGALPVTDAPSEYSAADPMRTLDLMLRTENVVTPPVFGSEWRADAREALREYTSGERSAEEAFLRLFGRS